MPAAHARRRARHARGASSVGPAHGPPGFTLVECAAVCAAMAVLAAVAWPAWRTQQLRMGRLDAVAALTRVQQAQEQYRSLHGLYAHELPLLRGTGRTSAQGRYGVSLATLGPDAYRATATAQGAQRADGDCAALTLEVSLGFPHAGPSAACWNR
jgi:type IV pilus assembly protein PilE